MNIIIALTMIGTKGVKNVTNWLAVVVHFARLMNFERMNAWVYPGEISFYWSEITNFLSQKNWTFAVRLAKEVESAACVDGLCGLRGGLPVEVDSVDVDSCVVKRSKGGDTRPSKAIRIAIPVARVLVLSYVRACKIGVPIVAE